MFNKKEYMREYHNKEKYKNKIWLEKKYLKEKMNQIQIAKLCEVSRTTIKYFMKKFNIFCRSMSEANHLAKGNHCKLSKKAIEWLNGELLGDGYLRSDTIYSARFVYTSKYIEYIQYVSNTLESFGIKQSGRIREEINKNQDNLSYKYNSIFYEELYPIYKQWYPNGKKIIPRDIKLTPLTLRQHYIGDGCLIHSRFGRPHIELATCGFTIYDVEWLIKQLKNLEFKTTRHKYNNVIHISRFSTKDFLDYIGSCPVKCY